MAAAQPNTISAEYTDNLLMALGDLTEAVGTLGGLCKRPSPLPLQDYPPFEGSSRARDV